MELKEVMIGQAGSVPTKKRDAIGQKYVKDLDKAVKPADKAKLVVEGVQFSTNCDTHMTEANAVRAKLYPGEVITD